MSQCWDFFSSPKNLKEITPDDLGLEIVSEDGRKIYPGQLIRYDVRPLWNIRVPWLTEITHVVEKEYFVDEQRSGPYSFWHHKHFFKTIENGVEIEDVVDYQVPFGFLGQILHSVFILSELERIFDYRREKLTKLFGTAGVPLADQ